MRLLLVSFIDENGFSGMGKWTHRVASGLRARGHAVDCWWNNDFPALRRQGRWAALGFPPVLAAHLVAARDRYDAVVVHEPSALAYALARKADRRLPPLVAMCHNVESKVHRQLVAAARAGFASMPLGRRIKPHLVRTWQSDGAVRAADAVACLSSEDARYLERLGVTPGRIVAFPNGVDAGRFRAAPRTAAEARRVLFVGGWLDVKGRRLVPAAWPSVHARVPGATLTLLGTGAGEVEVLADFPPHVRPSVRVRPRVVDESDVAAEFASHGLFFMPSLTEGSPLALMESMASGLPAVATAVGGIPDLLEDGRTGLLAPPLDARACAEALSALLEDPGRAGHLGTAARARAEGLGWDRAAAALERACLLARGELT